VTSSRFDSEALASAEHDLVIGVRAGASVHRFTPVWCVVVEDRLFIRSWGLSERSWFSEFRRDPHGTVQIAGREFDVRATRTRSESLLAAVDEAYRRKYHTASSAAYVLDMTSAGSRATTTELEPVVESTA